MWTPNIDFARETYFGLSDNDRVVYNSQHNIGLTRNVVVATEKNTFTHLPILTYSNTHTDTHTHRHTHTHTHTHTHSATHTKHTHTHTLTVGKSGRLREESIREVAMLLWYWDVVKGVRTWSGGGVFTVMAREF